MVIVIEGPDGSGKSTLAEFLSSVTGYEVVHRKQPKTQKEKDDMFKMYHEALDEGRNVIFDRAWYSEIIYGSIMRDASCISFDQMKILNCKLAKKGLLIYCTSDVNTLWRRCQERGEDYITDKATMIDIHQSYDALLSAPNFMNLKVLKYEN